MQVLISASVALALLLIGAHSVQLASGQSSSCHLRELDLCATSLLVFTQSPNGLATSDQEIQKQCSHLREAEGCFKNFTRRCMTPIQRELITFASNSSFQLLEDYCTKGSKFRQTYLKHAQCLGQISKKQEYKSCTRDLQIGLELITSNNANFTPNLRRQSASLSSSSSSSPNGNQNVNKTMKHSSDELMERADHSGSARPSNLATRLQTTCCAYRRFESCLASQMERKCGKETVQFVANTVRRITSRLPENLCRKLKPDGQECRALLPKPGSSPPKGSKSNSIVARLLSAYSGL